MKHIKLFGLFENETYTKSKTYGSAQHKEFCEEVAKWSEENDKPVLWCLYGNPGVKGFGLKMEYSKKYWDAYVKGDKQFTLVEMDGMLVGVLHTGDNIEMAFDNTDKPVESSKIKDLI